MTEPKAGVSKGAIVALVAAIAVVTTAIAAILVFRGDGGRADLTQRHTLGESSTYSLSIDDGAETSDGLPITDSGYHVTMVLALNVSGLGEASTELRVSTSGTELSFAGETYDGNALVDQTLNVGADGTTDVMLAATSDPTGAGYYYADLIFPVVPQEPAATGDTWSIAVDVAMAQGTGGTSYDGTGQLVRFEKLNGTRTAVVRNVLDLTYGYTIEAGRSSALVVGGDPSALGTVEVSGSGTYTITAWVDPSSGRVLKSVGAGTYDLTTTRSGFPSTVVPEDPQTSTITGSYTQQLATRA